MLLLSFSLLFLMMPLPIISVCSVLPVIMLILKFYGSRIYTGVDHLTAGRHFQDFFCNDRIVHSLAGILSPCKDSVIFAKYRRHSNIIFFTPLKFIRDQNVVFFS